MPTRDTAPTGAPCWVDLMTADPERSRAFYRTPAENTPYGRLATAADPTGGQFKLVAANEAMPAKDASD